MKKCPSCGAQISDDSRFCAECGKEIPQGIVCPHCGSSVKEGDAFCPACGYKMKQENECPHCGVKLNDSDIFCQNCGAKIKTTVSFEPQQKLDFNKNNSFDSNNQGNLFIRWNGRWAIIDCKVLIWVNGVKQGEYSFKDGFEVIVPISSPEMVVETRLGFHKTKKVLSLNPQENYSYNLVYNNLIGSFGFVLCDNDGKELETDKLHWGYFILFFLVPLVGFIYALSVRKKKPATSKQAFMISLLSVVVSLILSFFMPVAMSRYSEMRETEKFVADSIVEDKQETITNVESDKSLIKDFYQYVFGKKEMNDDILDKYLSAELKKSLWTEDYDGCYEYWLFRTYAQDSKPDNDVSKIEGIKELGDGWYEVKYLDMGWNGTTKVKVKEDKIVEFVKDQSWDGEY